jgi:protein arginine N-methyltransferase 5
MFVHPTSDTNFARTAELIFTIPVTCDVTGFAGYFDVVLYKNNRFCTIPGLLKNASLSWFPCYIPVRNPIRCPAGSTLNFNISRCTNSQSQDVWYEWQETVILVSLMILHFHNAL